MASNPALPNDLVLRSLRTLSSQETAVGTVLLGDAWTIITTRIPSVVGRIDALPLNVGLRSLLVQIECAMVLRVLNNPDGKLEESGDDYTYRLDSAVSTGALYLSDAEENLIGSGTGGSEAFTIKPAGTKPDLWTNAGSMWF